MAVERLDEQTIVERLRDLPRGKHGQLLEGSEVDAELRCEAADEIERLQQEIGECQVGWQTGTKLITEAEQEIERLKEQLHHCNGTCDLAIKGRAEAEAEIRQLRAALQHIADTADYPFVLQTIARRALEIK